MKITEAIILAGGLGTRLRNEVPDLPKCMADVGGKPFISYVVEHCISQGIQRFVFALGYKSEQFESFLSRTLPAHSYTLSIEDEPLGTGGAVKLACGRLRSPSALVLNGDTLFRIELEMLSTFHRLNEAECTLALKPMKDFDRYGVVELGPDNRIIHFHEKMHYSSGLINGGVYCLEVARFLGLSLADKFSFEKDYLEKYFTSCPMYGLVQDQYFIDIGIPEDYKRANTELITSI